MLLPTEIAARIARCVQGEDGPDLGIDQEARTHGAIALMGTIGMIWGLRPDGSFWMFDQDFEVALEPLPADCETQALVWGARRFPWLSALRGPGLEPRISLKGHDRTPAGGRELPPQQAYAGRIFPGCREGPDARHEGGLRRPGRRIAAGRVRHDARACTGRVPFPR
jgi:hypothetical protein